MTTKLNALKRAGIFDGSNDVERWIDRMEMALRIDEVPESKHADALAMSLAGPAYDTWKNMAYEKKADAAAIKTALRNVFGLRRFDAWRRAAASDQLAPGTTVDVVYEELRKFVTIATTGEPEDPVGRMAACFLVDRLPAAVRDQVLLQCGEHMRPAEVVACAKQLMPSTNVDAIPAYAAARGSAERWPAVPRKQGKQHGAPGRWWENTVCYQCGKKGHIKRNCSNASTTVSGNGITGQPLE